MKRPLVRILVFLIFLATISPGCDGFIAHFTRKTPKGQWTHLRAHEDATVRPGGGVPDIAEATLDDMQAVTELCIEAFFGSADGAWPWKSSHLRRLREFQVKDLTVRHGRRLGTRRVKMLKAVDDSGTVVGFVEVMEKVPGGTYDLPVDDPKRDARAFAANLAVSQKARRAGIGQRLVERAAAEAEEWGFDTLYVQVEEDNVNACSFYEALGFSFLLRDPAARRFNAEGLFLRTESIAKLTLWKGLPFTVASVDVNKDVADLVDDSETTK